MVTLVGISRRFAVALGIFFGLCGIADAHSGILDGYGCHLGPDKVSYHCHRGRFAGRTFKSKADFLRELRGGKSEHLAPRNNPPPPEKKADRSISAWAPAQAHRRCDRRKKFLKPSVKVAIDVPSVTRIFR